MAEWEHKERNWDSRFQQDASGKSVKVHEMIREKGDRHGRYEINSNFMEFADWLDMQCKGGWEVFKISRNWVSGAWNSTWCIFRRLV